MSLGDYLLLLKGASCVAYAGCGRHLKSGNFCVRRKFELPYDF